MTVKLYADGADLKVIGDQLRDPRIKGFTLNSTLMRKSNITNYQSFIRELLIVVPPLVPVSLPVLSMERREMQQQALRISELGSEFKSNVYVKIPVVDLEGNPLSSLIGDLSVESIPVNVTGITTYEQVMGVLARLEFGSTTILSVFCGRVADSGCDPLPLMKKIAAQLRSSGSLHTNVELLWASVREPFNVIQADQSGCDIITLPKEMLDRLSLFGRDLDELSKETVTGFYKDGVEAGWKI